MNEVLHTLGLKFDWGFTLTLGSLILTRLTMITSTIPFLVGKPVPGSIRMGLTAVLMVFLYPYLKPDDPSLIPSSPVFLFLLFAKEAFYGIAIGLAASIVFYAFQAAGDVIDNQRGAAQARLLIPQLGEQASVFGVFNYILGIVVFLSLNGHIPFLRAMMESYSLLPLLEMPKAKLDLLAMTDEFIRTTGSILLVALQLTAPVIIAIFLADVVLGIMSKAAPSINIWELSFAIRGVIGVVVFYLSIAFVIPQMGKLSLGMVDTVIRIFGFLSP